MEELKKNLSQTSGKEKKMACNEQFREKKFCKESAQKFPELGKKSYAALLQQKILCLFTCSKNNSYMD